MDMKAFIREHRIFLVILLLALLLRLAYLPYAKFENETARDLSLANQIIDQKELRLKGVSSEVDPASTQQSFGPLFYYFLASSQLVYHHPYSAIFLMIVITLLSVALFYYLVYRYYGKKVALIAAALFAFNPWVFAFVSLNFATPNFLLPFIILLYFSLFKIIVDKKDSYLILTAVSLAAMLQFHLSSVLLIPITFFYLILFRPSVFKSRYLLYALGVAFLFFIPFFLYALQQHSFQNIFDFLFSSRTFVSRFENLRDSVGIPFMLATMYFGPYLLGNLHVFHSAFLESLFLALDFIIAFLIGLSILFLLRKVIHDHYEQKKRDILLLGWFTLPIILAIIPGANVSPHYLYITYPSQFLLLALFFTKFPIHLTLRKISLSLILVAFVVYIISFYSAVITAGGTDGIYGVPLKSKINVLEYASNTKPDGNLLFYGYVKPEYDYLKPYYTPHLKLSVVNNETVALDALDGYLLLDFYSRGNFGEQSMSPSDSTFYRSLPSVKIGQISLVDMEDYRVTLLQHNS